MTSPNKYDHTLASLGKKATQAILDDFAANGHVKISLSQFRADILPHLANPDNHDISYWLRYVKHPMLDLHVMEPDNVTVKYVVPALAGRLGATAPSLDGRAIHDKLIDARRRIERSPRSAERELQQTLSPHINLPTRIVHNRIELNKILVAEGYTPLQIPGAAPGVTGIKDGKPTAEPGGKIEYSDEYDEL